MENFQGGGLLRTVEKALPAEGKALAENFLLFGLLAEIFMKANGFNGGMGGSMHAFFTPFGAYPNNAIVGASAGIATGAALRKKLSSDRSITVALSGDGSTGCGPVFEAMNFAAMAQYKTLWTDAHKGGLPVLFCFNNNFYAMGGQTIGETMGWDRLSRIAAAINPEAMHAETVDGTNPLAVADAVARKRALLLAGEGPALLDVECYRVGGHSTTDANVYRSKEELAAWEPHDAIAQFAAKLIAAGVLDDGAVAAMRAQVVATMTAVTRAAVDPAIAPLGRYSRRPHADRPPDVFGYGNSRAIRSVETPRTPGNFGSHPPGRQEIAERHWPRWRKAFGDAGHHAARRAVRAGAASHGA